MRHKCFAQNRKQKHGFYYLKNLLDFEVFCWNILSTIINLFIKSVLDNYYQNARETANCRTIYIFDKNMLQHTLLNIVP